MLTEIANWGNYPRVKSEILNFSKTDELESLLKSTDQLTIRGAGLSYGDASLSASILSTNSFNRIISFDHETGVITVESGVTLEQILMFSVPKGWFLYVTPGTKFITVGGAIGGDIHGKNHHVEGSFCNYVMSMNIMLPNGTILTCNRESNEDIFHTICGGVGLGAFIISASIKLRKISTSFIKQTNIIVNNLDQMIQLLIENLTTTYVVAWIDCLTNLKSIGKGVLMLGEHAEPNEVNTKNLLEIHKQPNFNVPIFPPINILNSYTIKVFNLLYFHKHKLFPKRFITHYDSFFYPLDKIKNWNRLYGKNGFLQYQFVIPTDSMKTGLSEILKRILRSRQASFLTVLKILGKSENVMSFPMPGATLALDFPVNKKVLQLLDSLDTIIHDLGGRVYLVKDARMKPNFFHKSYPNINKFQEILNTLDPNHKFSSHLAERLKIRRPNEPK